MPFEVVFLAKLNLYKFWLAISCQKRWIRRVHYGGGSVAATCFKSGIYLKKVSISMCPFPKHHYEITSAALQLRRQVLSDESDRPDRLSLSNNRPIKTTTSPLGFSCQ